jgi:Holliday junction resolvase
MAMTPEKKVKQRVVAQLKTLGAYYFYPVTGGFGSSGVPDIVCCYQGRFIGIECKAGKGKTTALQDKNLTAISEAGGVAMVVNEENVDLLTQVLSTIGNTQTNHRIEGEMV